MTRHDTPGRVIPVAIDPRSAEHAIDHAEQVERIGIAGLDLRERGSARS